jgi:hypothetical protein
MKTIFAVLAFIFVSAGVSASGNLRVSLTGPTSESATLKISNTQLSTYDIKVTDENGRTIFTKQTESSSKDYIRQYDFSQLENGIYFLTVKAEKTTNETKFSVKNGAIELIGERKILEPYFNFEDDKLKMTFLNFSTEESTLIVYDDKRNELYSKKLSADFNIQHGLDMSNLPKGAYEIVLSTDSNLYDFNVSID